jgi:hypothetical protein
MLSYFFVFLFLLQYWLKCTEELVFFSEGEKLQTSVHRSVALCVPKFASPLLFLPLRTFWFLLIPFCVCSHFLLDTPGADNLKLEMVQKLWIVWVYDAWLKT